MCGKTLRDSRQGCCLSFVPRRAMLCSALLQARRLYDNARMYFGWPNPAVAVAPQAEPSTQSRARPRPPRCELTWRRMLTLVSLNISGPGSTRSMVAAGCTARRHRRHGAQSYLALQRHVWCLLPRILQQKHIASSDTFEFSLGLLSSEVITLEGCSQSSSAATPRWAAVRSREMGPLHCHSGGSPMPTPVCLPVARIRCADVAPCADLQSTALTTKRWSKSCVRLTTEPPSECSGPLPHLRRPGRVLSEASGGSRFILWPHACRNIRA